MGTARVRRIIAGLDKHGKRRHFRGRDPAPFEPVFHLGQRLEADVLLPFFGLAMKLGPIAKWGLNRERKHITANPATCETSTPGIFAIGDIAVYPGKLKLTLSGFSEAAMTAHAVHPLVFPGKAPHFEYATFTGVPDLGRTAG